MNHDNRAARFAAREETLRPVATRAGRRRGAWGGITTAWESLAREEIEQAALDLIRRRGHEILATARRYAQTLDDADDAYQRGLEILLRKAPTTSEVSHALAEGCRQARGLQPSAPAGAPLADHRRRPARRPPHAAGDHP